MVTGRVNKKAEWIAGLLVIILLVLPAIYVGYGWYQNNKIPVIHARMAETGGWLPENLKGEVGKPLKLRLTSDDVMHSFALGQSSEPPVDVKPGEITEITLNFDRAGKYTFYCTRWCSVNHWRMRGVIEVTDPAEISADEPDEEKQPLFVKLGLDIDAVHQTEAPLPKVKPAAVKADAISAALPQEITSYEYYLSHTPEEVFNTLKNTPGLSGLSEQDLWNLAAGLWKSHITPESLENGKNLYAENCAACHGEQGDGDGVFADELSMPNEEGHSSMTAGAMTEKPADFTNADQMLSASPAHLQGKIVRGGMGTGMPYWGPIFTEEETWDLVAFLWSFQFDFGGE